MKMTIGRRIGLGFAALLAILSVTGGIAVYQMHRASTGAANMSSEYLPEVSVASRLQASADRAALNVRSFALSGDAAYLQEAHRALAEVDAALKDAEALAGRSSLLVHLKAGITSGRSLFQTYSQLVDETDRIQTEQDHALDAARSAAETLLTSTQTLIDDQNAKLEKEIAGGADAAATAERRRKIATLIAGRRLLDNPKAAFRFISGLVIALFVASALVGALSSIAVASSSGGGNAGKGTLAELFCSFSTSNCSPGPTPSSPCWPTASRSRTTSLPTEWSASWASGRTPEARARASSPRRCRRPTTRACSSTRPQER